LFEGCVLPTCFHDVEVGEEDLSAPQFFRRRNRTALW
jgi:hypothetical protein